MSEINNVSQSSFHQRSQSMPLRHTFINNNHSPLYEEDEEVSPPSYNFNGIHRSLKQESGITPNNDSFPITPPSKLTYSQYRPSISDDGDNSNFFNPSEPSLDVFDKNNNRCPISLDCRLTKGFFKSDSHWTCYRRNYFQVTASLVIPNYSDLEHYTLGPERRHIKQFFVHVRACVVSAPGDKGSNSSVKLTQMTPKRDKGPVRDPPMIPICPTNYVTFERLQFKAATANNGRRKASQQFYCLVLDVSAQLEDETLHVVSTCTSMPLVVRGRSPGHYNCERKRIKSPKINEKSNESTPAPTYVYSPPPPSEPLSSVPQMMFTAFNPHGRSQSANDPQFLARHRKYQTTESYQQSLFHDDSMAGIDKALRHWELQAAKFREESASAFHSYIPEGSEASTPTPYNNTLSHSNEDERPYYNWS